MIIKWLSHKIHSNRSKGTARPKAAEADKLAKVRLESQLQMMDGMLSAWLQTAKLYGPRAIHGPSAFALVQNKTVSECLHDLHNFPDKKVQRQLKKRFARVLSVLC